MTLPSLEPFCENPYTGEKYNDITFIPSLSLSNFRVFVRYYVVKKIGEGAYGDVYLVVNQFQEVFVIKVNNLGHKWETMKEADILHKVWLSIQDFSRF